jgi:hypothetical protein
MDPNERARKLVALATDKGASHEEARTAAMAACRLIVKHKLLDSLTARGQGPADDGHVTTHGHGPTRRPSRERSPHDAGHARHEGRHETRHDERTSYRADRPGTCAFCATPFGPNDDVMTYPNHAVDHWHCAKRRAAGAEPGF